MNDVLDAIIFYDDLTAEQQKALLTTLEDNPKLAESFDRWRKLQQQVRSSLSSQLPDRNVLVLYALAKEDAQALSASEQRALTEAKSDIEEALKRHPALENVILDIRSARADFIALWDDFAEKSTSRKTDLKSFAPPRPAIVRTPRRDVLYRLAASFLLLVLASTAGILTWRSQNLEIVKTSPGEFRVVELMDGSTVRLYEKSKISYAKHSDRFSENRSIELRGRAFFDIAPDASPFTVQTPTALTLATGTRFSIEASRSITKVILTAGQVAVYSRQRKGENILLSPGEMSLVPRRKQPSQPESIGDLTDVLSWTGLLVFHDTPLDQVATHLSEYFHVSVSIDPQLRDERWVATYDPDTLSIGEILDNLAASLGATVESTAENTYRLHR